MADGVTFFVPGVAIGKGSKRAFVTKTGRAVVVDTNAARMRQWASDVKTAALQAWGDRPPIEAGVPVGVECEFLLPRPQVHLKANGQLKSWAPVWTANGRDGDKLTRTVWDALTGVVWVDDRQVAMWLGSKSYAVRPGRPGLKVRCWVLPDTQGAPS